ncbi:MAG: glycosyltransferase family 39 protein [Gemmatimonadota bacterium]|nr:glycosyltransferase family 39 protein [Gemmatimonadota bacterium]MDH3422278.1 glycosyltransferase family 39 protein [Gemmatimonadota bacterium]
MTVTALRAVGVALVFVAFAPLHRLLGPARAGPAGEASRASAEAAWGFSFYGALIVLGTAVVLTLALPEVGVGRLVARAADRLSRPRRGVFAISVGTLAGGLSLAIAWFLYRVFPTSVDEMAQLLNAQALAGGLLAMPVPGNEAAWSIQNGLVVPQGWVSIYPPLHTLLLAVGLRAGAAWLVGPLAVAVATWAAALSFEELLGRRVGRGAAIVLAVSPFWVLLGATYLSHTTAAACLALVLWAGLRARSGSIGWAVAAGASMGASVTARPWIGLVSSATLLAALWWDQRDQWVRRVGSVVAGGLPFAALLFAWNSRLFGGPLRLGYSAAYGPPHSLGLHIDPWGNAYGLTEAVAYTGVDLALLGAHLLEAPLSVVAVIGVALLLGMRGAGTTPLLAWVITAVVANALYWHHGIHWGPRMLYEATPAWVALGVASAAYVMREGVSPLRMRRMAGWAIAAAGIGALALLPGVLMSAARSSESLAYVALPDPPGEEPALVFIHGSWSSRVVARLTATGMRRDSVETALRRNDICAVDRYARWRAADPSARSASPPTLDLAALPGSPSHLVRTRISPGNDVWTEPGAPRDDRCLREARADSQGVVDLEPFLWRAPPLPGRTLVVTRDLGPEANATVLTALGSPTGYLYTPGVEGAGAPRLMQYAEGMESLWGGPR